MPKPHHNPIIFLAQKGGREHNNRKAYGWNIDLKETKSNLNIHEP